MAGGGAAVHATDLSGPSETAGSTSILFAEVVLSAATAGGSPTARSGGCVGDKGGTSGGAASESGTLLRPMSARNPVPKPYSVFREASPLLGKRIRDRRGRNEAARDQDLAEALARALPCSASASTRSCSLHQAGFYQQRAKPTPTQICRIHLINRPAETTPHSRAYPGPLSAATLLVL